MHLHIHTVVQTHHSFELNNSEHISSTLFLLTYTTPSWMGCYPITGNPPATSPSIFVRLFLQFASSCFLYSWGGGGGGERGTMRAKCVLSKNTTVPGQSSKPDCLIGTPVHLSTISPTKGLKKLYHTTITEELLTESDSLGLWGLGVAIWIHRQTSKSSPAILWLSTRIRDSLALKNRTALFHALESLCLFEKKETFFHQSGTS